MGRASAEPHLGEGFGILNRSPDPLVRQAGRDYPFPISVDSPLRERDVERRVGRERERERERIFIDDQEMTEGR